MSYTTIEWADATWNPIIGCSKVSAGCENCYAERIAARLAKNSKTPQYKYVVGPDGKWNGRLYLDLWNDKPRSWKKEKRIFVGSMSDVFQGGRDMDSAFYDYIFDVVESCPQHTFMFLTKYPYEMKAYIDLLEKIGDSVPGNAWAGRPAERDVP